MSLFVLGINHKTAPVHVREKVNFDPPRLPGALRELVGLPEVHEGLIISTCNRTELYCVAGDGGSPEVRNWLTRYQSLDASAEQCLYSKDREAAVRHAFHVACGLDSMILGEPQILGQFKEAYRAAHEAGAVGPLLNRLFQKAFAVAKNVRTDTGIGTSAVSVAYAAVSLARQIFASFDRHTALLIGAGQTIELVARHLHAQGMGRMIVANRRVERAHAFAASLNAFAIGLEEMPGHLAEADIIVSSTASPDPILTRELVEAALKKRRRRPVFAVDLAVPRDIAPDVASLADVYLYTVDDLESVIDENLRLRREAALEAEAIVDAEVEQFRRALRLLDAVPLIREVRERSAGVRADALAAAHRQLAAGHAPAEVVEQLASALTKKILHQPTTRLRRAGEEEDAALLQAARELFGLDDP